ncbi:MAG: hypothetical protein LBN06_08655 [Prevotellaceae bacterium]|jgi:hypothetical protein|nr:hypothetical protein [Prevotellaceae bacterium]
MKYFKYISGLFVATMTLTLVGCGSDDDNYTPGEPAATDCMNVYFDASNATSIELAPTAASFNVVVMRPDDKKASAASVPLEMINGADFFEASTAANFAAGETSTTITVSAKSGAPTGENLTVELAIKDPAYANPYSTGLAYYGCTAMIVQWNTLGEGQFFDSFCFVGSTFAAVAKVTIQQRDDIPTDYRISYPYSEAILEAAEWTGWYPGVTQANIIFHLDPDTDAITWDRSWKTNLIYQGTVGQNIEAFMPNLLSDSSESYAVRDNDGNIVYFSLSPYYYINGLGGFGVYPCYLGFPGIDLAGMLGVGVFE